MNMETTNKIKPGAIFHFDCKVHGRSTGANAIRLAAYRAGERLRSDLTGRIHNYTQEEGSPPPSDTGACQRSGMGPGPCPAMEHDRHHGDPQGRTIGT